MTSRLNQTVLILSVLAGSWLAMQMVHELGHVLAAMASGGRVERVVFHPATISRTDLSHNPRPLVVAIGGPLLGSILPLLLWAACRRLEGAFVLRFFAGFCLVANGLYVAVGSFWGIGDSGAMLRHGSALWHLWLVGALAAAAGLWLWHGQGRHFGLGPEAEPVSRDAAWLSAAGCAGLLLAGLLAGRS